MTSPGSAQHSIILESSITVADDRVERLRVDALVGAVAQRERPGRNVGVDARPELDQGTLVRILNVAWPQEFAYWLVSPRVTAETPKVVAFRSWLISERADWFADPASQAAPAQMP